MPKKISPEQVQEILKECQAEYWEVQHTLATACAIRYNGFVLAVEFSACTSIDHFDKEVGRNVAYECAIRKAESKIWEMLGIASLDPLGLRK